MPRSARGDVEVGGLDQPQQDVLDILADVAGLGQRGGVGDAEGHVQDARQRLRQQRLAAAGRADQQDVALAQLDVVDLHPGGDALVVVVDGDGEHLLGAILPDDVLVELLEDLLGRRDLGDRELLLRRVRPSSCANRFQPMCRDRQPPWSPPCRRPSSYPCNSRRRATDIRG